MKSKLSALLLVSALASIGTISAQDQAQNDSENKVRPSRESFNRGEGRKMDRNGRGGMMMPGMGQNSRETVEKQLKEKYAAEYAEVEKLRKEAETKLQALAKKAGLTLPDTMETLREKAEAFKTKYAAELEEIKQLKETDRRAAFAKIQELLKKENLDMRAMFMMMGNGPQERFNRGGGDRPDAGPAPESKAPGRGNAARAMRQLREKFPTEMKELDQLRRDDPRAYREKLQGLMKKLEAEKPAPAADTPKTSAEEKSAESAE